MTCIVHPTEQALKARIKELEWEYASVVNQYHDELKHNTKLEAENLALAKDSNIVADENQRLREALAYIEDKTGQRFIEQAAQRALLGGGEK